MVLFSLVAGCGQSEEEILARIEKQLRELAAEWDGTPYRDGGTSREGIDCSGLVQTLYREVFDQELPRSAKAQEKACLEITVESLRPGDLIFFRTKGIGPFFKRRHVGVYLSDREFVHASSSKGVTISSLDDHYWKTKFHKAARISAGEEI